MTKSRLLPPIAKRGGRQLSRLASAVDRGIANGEFRLDFQPKLDLRQGTIRSIEALIRWQHPRRGLVMPDQFIGLVEETGKIRALTLWVVDGAVAEQRRLAAAGHNLFVFFNLSAQLLTDDAIIDALCSRAGEARLGIEITERSVIADPHAAFANISRLRAAGCLIAIDDYGAGLSSLTYLKQIEADELKIDKSFILALGTSHRDPLIVRSTIDLAHALDMVVTAEGVETPAAHALLSVMGCDMVQGYLIARPMPAHYLPEFLSGFDAQSLRTPADGRALTDQAFWRRA